MIYLAWGMLSCAALGFGLRARQMIARSRLESLSMGERIRVFRVGISMSRTSVLLAGLGVLSAVVAVWKGNR